MVLPSSSSSPLHQCATSVFQFDKPFSPASFEERGERQTPPPLPPKPNHPSEQQKDGSDGSHRTIITQTYLFPRRTSLSSLDRYRIGLLSCHGATCILLLTASEGNSNNHFFFQEMLTEKQQIGGRVLIWWDNQNQNQRPEKSHTEISWQQWLQKKCYFLWWISTWVFFQPRLNTVRVQNCEDESYVPMVSPSSVTTPESNAYISMSPRTFSFLNTDNNSESASLSPPPIHRHLKPSLRRGEYQHHLGSWMLQSSWWWHHNWMLIHSQTCNFYC